MCALWASEVYEDGEAKLHAVQVKTTICFCSILQNIIDHKCSVQHGELPGQNAAIVAAAVLRLVSKC